MTIITNGDSGLDVKTAINTFHDEMSREAVLAREGFGRHARNTWNTLSMWSDDYMAASGVGGTDFFPRSITAGQSGTTVTATTSVFLKLYVGAIIQWDSGEEAVITEIDNSGSAYAAITTCTVDRSQTVSSSAATIKAKHLVGVTYGDSVGNRIAGVLSKSLWRALGFGGIVINANNVLNSSGPQIVNVTLAGGATDDTSDSHFADYPWGARWAVPSGGTIQFGLIEEYATGVSRSQRNSLAQAEKKFDTVVIVWRRAAGAFTVERRRIYDPAWESVATVADASTGSASWNYAKYTHTLGSEWEYRITGTSGTVYFQSFALRNDSAPGFVYWPLSRGGELISDFDQISSAELAELCAIHQQPDFRTIFAYDTVSADTDASDYSPEIEADRDLWAAATPKMDHIWFTGWEATSDQAEQLAWNEAVIAEAKANDDPLVPMAELFGDFATSGSLRGWIEDGVHPSIKGEVIIGHMLFRALGLADHPTIREWRDISAFRGDFANLRVLGRSVPTQIKRARDGLGEPTRGATWVSGTCRLWADDILPAALGTSDFTIHLDVLLPTSVSASNSLFVVSTNALTTATNSELVVLLDGTHRLNIILRNGSGTALEHRFSQFLTAYGGTRGCLTIRSDVANTRFDLFWNGEPAVAADGTTSGAGDALGTWTGVGTEVGMIQATSSANCATIYGAMMWASRLTDEQINQTIELSAPATAAMFWWDFSEGSGRVVRDHSGNSRHAIFANTNPNQYSISAGPTWSYPKQRLNPQTVALSLAATTVLVSGDDIIAAYGANRDLLLPATAVVGDRIRVTVNSASTIRITQNASQRIKSGASATTAGTGGRLTIPDATSVTLVCITGGASTVWTVQDHTGAALTFT